jgi:AbiU2
MTEQQPPKVKLELLLAGLVADLYAARRSFELLMTIGKKARCLEGTRFARFFQETQGILSDHYILHVTKMFEVEGSGKGRPLSGIPSIIRFISTHMQEWMITQPNLTNNVLHRIGVQVNANKVDAPTVVRTILSHFQSNLPSRDRSDSLKAFLTLRNKRIAHREPAELPELPQTTYQESSVMLKYADEFVCAVGISLTGTGYGLMGEDFKETFIEEETGFVIRSLESVIEELIQAARTEEMEIEQGLLNE